MKRAASGKHRQAVKIMQFEKKLFILLKLENVLRNMRLQHIRRWPIASKAFLSACCC